MPIGSSQQTVAQERNGPDSTSTYRLGVLRLRVALVALGRRRRATLIVLCSRHGTI